MASITGSYIASPMPPYDTAASAAEPISPLERIIQKLSPEFLTKHGFYLSSDRDFYYTPIKKDPDFLALTSHDLNELLIWIGNRLDSMLSAIEIFKDDPRYKDMMRYSVTYLEEYITSTLLKEKDEDKKNHLIALSDHPSLRLISDEVFNYFSMACKKYRDTYNIHTKVTRPPIEKKEDHYLVCLRAYLKVYGEELKNTIYL